MRYASDLIQEVAPMKEWELDEFFRAQFMRHQPNRWARFYDWTEQHKKLCFLAWGAVFNIVIFFMPENESRGNMLPVYVASAVVFLPILIARVLSRPGAEWVTCEAELDHIDDREYALLGGKERCKCFHSALMLPIGHGMKTPLAEVAWIVITDASGMNSELARRGVRTWVHAVEI